MVLKADRVLGGSRCTKVASTGYGLFICSSPLRIRGGGATNAIGRDEAGRYLANAREWLSETRTQRLTGKRYLPLSRNCRVIRSTFGLLRVRLGLTQVVCTPTDPVSISGLPRQSFASSSWFSRLLPTVRVVSHSRVILLEFCQRLGRG